MLKKTKIITTISDINCDVELIKKLHEAGADVVRLNTAHQDFEGTKKVIQNVRKVSNKIPFLLDTKGPEIRTSKSKAEVVLKKGEKIFVDGNPDKEISSECIYVTYPNFSKDVSVKDKILIDDGDVELEVIEKKGGRLLCVVRNDGIVKGKKSVNVPNVHIKLPSLSKKDLEYIDFAVENKIDFIAHSFVRNREDLLEIQKILDRKKSSIKIIAKIENQEGVDNIDDILNYCYGIMIARGDLGIELPAEKIPIVQRDIIKKCIEKRKPVIVATQMLHTMINNPRPTRAEVSDVANAVYLGADAIMLSGETAYGKYPLEAVKTMTNIAKEVESNKISFDESSAKSINKEIVGFLTKSAVRASLLLPTKAIVVDTTTGRTARYLSAYRGKNVIFALCYDEKVMRELALSYGVYPRFAKSQKTTREFIRELVVPMLEKAQFKKDDLIIVVAGSFGPSHGASFLEISTVENLIK
jgi:pyruvate kinase